MSNLGQQTGLSFQILLSWKNTTIGMEYFVSRLWSTTLNCKKNRSVATDNRCVFSTSGQFIEFIELEIGEHSSISGYSRNGKLIELDNEKRRYNVESVSLSDLLKTHSAPQLIHFLSIDTEGSEYEILKNFNFLEYQFVFICIEISQNADQIHQFLMNNNFIKILPQYSRWDGWYVHSKYSNLIQDLT